MIVLRELSSLLYSLNQNRFNEIMYFYSIPSYYWVLTDKQYLSVQYFPCIWPILKVSDIISESCDVWSRTIGKFG